MQIDLPDPMHRRIFEEAAGMQRKNLLKRLWNGWQIVRQDGLVGCIDIRRNGRWRMLTKSGKDRPA